MDKIYDLKYKSGPHGDACTTYELVFYKENITLREFIEAVVKGNPKEWGEFYIKYLNPKLANIEWAAEHEKYSECKIEYKYGTIHYQIETSVEKLVWNMIIDTNDKKMFANGGWGSMSYWITIK